MEEYSNKESLEKLEERKPTQMDKIKNALRNAGNKGVLSSDLEKICSRFSARLHDLRIKGYEIITKKANTECSVFKYILISEPKEEILVKTGKEIVFNEIENSYGNSISTIELNEILVKNECYIARKRKENK